MEEAIGYPLKKAKLDKIKELESAYSDWELGSWLDNISGYSLFLKEKDRINYTQLKSIISDRTDGTLCEVGTTTGWQTIEKTSLYNILVRYGEYAMSIYKKFSDLTIYINYICQTIEEVNAVTW